MTEQLVRTLPEPSVPGQSMTQLSPPKKRSYALALILTVQLMIVLDMTVVNVALPQIQLDLGFSAANLSWVLNAYTLTFGGLLLLGGRIGDVFGRRRAFMVGLTIFTLASLLGGLAQSSELLVVARALQGVGSAIAAPSVLALITTMAADDGERNRGLALFSAVSSAGASLGLILGGVLTGYASWRWSLFINVPIAAVVLVLARRFIGETARQPGRFDFTGALSATLGSVAIVYGFINAPTHGWTDPRVLGSIAAGVLALAVFVVAEGKVRQPLLELSLLRDRQRAGGIAAMALIIGAQFALFFFTVQFMQHVLGYGALRSGFAYLPLTLLIFATSRFAAGLSARYGVRPLIATGATLLLIANLWLAQLSTDSAYLTELLVPMMLIGVGAGLTFMPLTVAILAGVEPEHAGTASGVVQMSQQIGGAMGLAVLVTVYASHDVVGQVVPGMAGSFYTAAGMFALAIAITLAFIGRKSPIVSVLDN
jgi:EmrB/QacA subfamily drug resistance transporter